MGHQRRGGGDLFSVAFQTERALSRLSKLWIKGVRQPLEGRLIAGRMATGAALGLIVVPRHQLGMLHAQRPRSQKFIPPTAAKNETQPAQHGECDRPNNPPALRTQ
jgi:hypothetical protein